MREGETQNSYLLPNEALQAGPATLFPFYLDPVSNDPLVRIQPRPPSADQTPADCFGNFASRGHVELARVIALSPRDNDSKSTLSNIIGSHHAQPIAFHFKQKFKFRGEEYILGT